MTLTKATRIIGGIIIASACVACGGGGGSSPAPVVTPVSSATPTPGAQPALVPSALNFTSTGATAIQIVSVAEAGNAGTFTATSSTCGAIATFPTAAFASSLQVTPIGPGSCTITIADTNGAHTVLPVDVTVTSVTGS